MVAGWLPLRCESQARRNFGVFGFDDVDNAFLFEALIGIFKCFFVDSFKIGEVALVIKRLTELVMWESQICVCLKAGGSGSENRRTSCALLWAFETSSHTSLAWPSGGVKPMIDTAASQLASMNGQIKKQ